MRDSAPSEALLASGQIAMSGYFALLLSYKRPKCLLLHR